jgi:hypothetical protein
VCQDKISNDVAVGELLPQRTRGISNDVAVVEELMFVLELPWIYGLFKKLSNVFSATDFAG